MFKQARHMIKVSWWQIFSISLLISFLIVICNIFIGVVQISQEYSTTIKNKLGINLYITNNQSEDVTNTQTVSLLRELRDAGLETTFVTKTQGMQSLVQRNQFLFNKIQESDIANPLPDRIFVVFDNQEEFRTMIEISENYESIIENYSNINSEEGLNFQTTNDQAVIINEAIMRSNANIVIATILVLITIVTILAFIAIMIVITFIQFRKQIEVEKLVGASYTRIQMPFIIKSFLILTLSMALSTIYLSLLAGYYGDWLQESYNINIYEFFSSQLLLFERIILFIFGFIVSSFTTDRLIRTV